MNFTFLKKIASYLPEIAIITAALYWFTDNLFHEESHINYIMLSIIAMILTLVLWRNKIYAIMISIIIAWANLYMVFAVVSEYMEYPSGDPEGFKLLTVGMLIFFSLGAIAGFMPWKYFKNSKTALSSGT